MADIYQDIQKLQKDFDQQHNTNNNQSGDKDTSQGMAWEDRSNSLDEKFEQLMNTKGEDKEDTDTKNPPDTYKAHQLEV